MNNFSTHSQSLTDWLSYLESIHPSEIELGLSRVKQVASKLGLLDQLGYVVLVGGTNGKGSTCAFIENFLLKSNKTTGVFSSPHVICYNERVRINGKQLNDASHVEALRFVEQGRGETTLTYFEFNTLAALYLMKQAAVDVFILEVGLGGRLDSTNIVDADLAVITTIDLDHQSWLGDTRDAVAFEKAGIFRQGQRVICGEPNPPNTLIEHAATLNCIMSTKTHDFSFELHGNNHWRYVSNSLTLDSLPPTRLPMTNAATAIVAFKHISEQLAVSFDSDVISDVIATTSLPGRLQTISHQPQVVLDVAHNPQAGGYLAQWLATQPNKNVHCVVAMLGDKDSQSTLSVLEPHVSQWYLASLDCPRGASASMLAPHVDSKKVQGQFNDVNDALNAAIKLAQADDIVLAFGSFFTVSAILSSQNNLA